MAYGGSVVPLVGGLEHRVGSRRIGDFGGIAIQAPLMNILCDAWLRLHYQYAGCWNSFYWRYYNGLGSKDVIVLPFK